MCLILGAEERALVMVKPPRQARITGVFEIDNCVLIPVKPDVKEELASPVCEALIGELRFGLDDAAIKTAEHRR